MKKPAARVGVLVAVFFTGVAGLFLMLSASRAMGEPQKEGAVKASARLEVDAKPDCFTVRFFLKNESDEAAELVYGYGGGGQELVPTIHIFGEGGRAVTITPPTYAYPQFRHLNPDTLSIPAHKEVLYGTYTMGYPPEGRLAQSRVMIQAYFASNERGQRAPRIRVHTEPIPFPPRQPH
jgi:hypothetical protein